MPTERFYKLPEDKRMAIKEAALCEFQRVPFEKVSINKIIREAGISRGSFYTYFEDTRDVLHYIFQDSGQKLQEVCRRSMKRHKGNFWLLLEDLFDYSIKNTAGGNLFQIFRTAILYQDLEQLAGLPKSHEEAAKGTIALAYECMDKTEFRITTLEEFHQVLELGMVTLATALDHYFRNPEDEENIKKMFRQKLELLQYGVCKPKIQ